MGFKTLLSYLEETASAYHRGTVSYDGNSSNILYLRDDIREERLQSQIDRMLRRLRPESSPEEEQSFLFGELHSTVRVFDEALIMHFPLGNDEGVIVALEPDAARSMNSFIRECHQQIDK